MEIRAVRKVTQKGVDVERPLQTQENEKSDETKRRCAPSHAERFEGKAGFPQRLALSGDPERDDSHEASYLLSHHHLHRPSDNMQKLRKTHPRTENKAKSKLAPIEDQEEPDAAAPGPTESTPDPQIGTSSLAMLSTSSVATLSTSSLPSFSTSTFFPTLSTSTLPTINSSIFPTPKPLTSRAHELKGIQTAFFQKMVYLTTFFCATQPPPLLIDSDLLLEYDKATARNSQIALLMKVYHLRANWIGGPPRMPQASYPPTWRKDIQMPFLF